MKKIVILFFLVPVVAVASTFEAAFREPSAAARPKVMWHWLSGNISEAGITKDLEAMQSAGIGGVVLYDIEGAIPAGPVDFLGDAWRQRISHSIRECQRLGLEFAMHNEGGWCSSGGSWVTPEESMKVIVYNAQSVRGPQEGAIQLSKPYRNLDYYRDVAVFAVPDAEPSLKPKLASEGVTEESLRVLVDENPDTQVTLKRADGAAALNLDLVFDAPVVARHLVVTPEPGRNEFSNTGLKLLVSDDGVRFRPVGTCTRSATYSGDHIALRNMPALATFPATTGRVFRVTCAEASLALADVRLSAEYRLPIMPQLTYVDGWWDGAVRDLPAVDATRKGVPAKRVIDLTANMAADGKLDWSVPQGPWTILRVGYTASRIRNASARGKGAGLEVDKLSAESVDRYWAGLLDKVTADNRAFLGKGFYGIELDNFEIGYQNWTGRFPELFKERTGYELRRFLPVLAGVPVEDMKTTEAFLWDYRQTISDIFVDSYSGVMRRKAHELGLKLYIESYHAMCDNFHDGANADITAGEFWGSDNVPGHACGRSATCKFTASIGNVYGKKIVGAEAFTASEYESGWRDHPYSYKALGDFAFTLGVNQFIYHRFAHQPFENIRPGLVMAHWGSHVDRFNTWWPYAADYLRYVQRCQSVLQQGELVADVAYYHGEKLPLREWRLSQQNPKHPRGYDYVVVSRDPLVTAVKAEKGNWHFPGMSTRLLMLPETDVMTFEVLQAVARVVSDGATVHGPRPHATPSLKDDAVAFKKLAEEVWGECDGKKVKEHAYGKGRVLDGMSVEEALNLPPDFAYTSEQEVELNAIHRTMNKEHVYFVANRREVSALAVCTFRVKGLKPEFWHPDTGVMEDAPVFRETASGIEIPLNLPPADSRFVVFRTPLRTEGADIVFTPESVRAKPPELLSRLKIDRAEFVFPDDNNKRIDCTERLVQWVTEKNIHNGGVIQVAVVRGMYGVTGGTGRAVMEVAYTLDGETFVETCKETHLAILNIGPLREKTPFTAFEIRQVAGKRMGYASVNGKVDVSSSDAKAGKPREIVVTGVPEPLAIRGPWSIQFGEIGPKECQHWEALKSWHHDSQPDIKCYSGTATYHTTFDMADPKLLSSPFRLYLDMGDVREVAKVSLNGKPVATLWKPPFCVEVTGFVKTGTNELTVDVANLWVNRLIGDEQYPRDYKVRNEVEPYLEGWPTWLAQGTPRTEPRRKAFTSYHIFKKESPLLPSGLLGPVYLRTVKGVEVDAL